MDLIVIHTRKPQIAKNVSVNDPPKKKKSTTDGDSVIWRRNMGKIYPTGRPPLHRTTLETPGTPIIEIVQLQTKPIVTKRRTRNSTVTICKTTKAHSGCTQHIPLHPARKYPTIADILAVSETPGMTAPSEANRPHATLLYLSERAGIWDLTTTTHTGNHNQQAEAPRTFAHQQHGKTELHETPPLLFNANCAPMFLLKKRLLLCWEHTIPNSNPLCFTLTVYPHFRSELRDSVFFLQVVATVQRNTPPSNYYQMSLGRTPPFCVSDNL